MYFVGIDISKFKHDCAIIDELCDTVMPSWSFSNDREGFSHFKALLDSLAQLRPGQRVCFTFVTPAQAVQATRKQTALWQQVRNRL